MCCKYWTGSSHQEGHRESKRHPKSIILVGCSSDVENAQKPTQFNPGYTLGQNNGKRGIIKKRCVSAGRLFGIFGTWAAIGRPLPRLGQFIATLSIGVSGAGMAMAIFVNVYRVSQCVEKSAFSGIAGDGPAQDLSWVSS